ncbi:Dyp-type peroxidase [Sediminivirga luteola]|uniref:Dyp-type peroxidase n=1 Tax=Sediminivirga luteola TaxID=1774748 RepID=UPI001F593B5D|nr:Dyp-type peroxidase [Sediminivirga luteola]MCI2265231.1 Dyp-type peroxidase [Sediminivirga luteola]
MSDGRDTTQGHHARDEATTGLRRRQLLGGAAIGAGILGAGAGGFGLASRRRNGAAETMPEDAYGTAAVPFHGEHQAGILTTGQAQATLIALDLRPDTGREDLRRMMRLLSADAARLAQGEVPLADSEPELALVPARLTVTFGFGPGFVEAAGGAAPSWLAPLPAFGVDRLDPAYCDGDLLIEVAADDPVTVAHAVRMLLKDARAFTGLRWTQSGFRRARGTEPGGTTMRNLFGQIDGTVNPAPGSEDFDQLVWCREGWLAGGTSLVIRRIHMDLEGWDRLDRPGREQSVGRTLGNGAPLTGGNEHDEPDFEALNAQGFTVIPPFAHIRRARSENPRERIVRRSYNYDDPPSAGQISDSGMIFMSCQADVDRQFVPIQRRLDELDLLNQWTTPVGSAVFAVPPGCGADGYIGETLLE